MSVCCIENQGNPLSMDIHNAILIGIDKELEIEKFNGENDLTIHLQGFEYTIELIYGVNDKLKGKLLSYELNW